jgi:hypothetical protein
VSARSGRYGAALLAVAALVALAAAAIAPAEGRHGAVAGAGIAFAVQVGLVVALGWLLPGRRLLAAGLAMLGRFATFAAVALVVILAPGAGLHPAATLLTLVAVFTVGALLEPVLLGSEPILRS